MTRVSLLCRRMGGDAPNLPANLLHVDDVMIWKIFHEDHVTCL